MRHIILLFLLLSSSVYAAKRDDTAVKAPTLNRQQQRTLFVLSVASALTNAQLEAADKDPSFVPEPVDGALAFPDTTLGLLMSPLCDDQHILQLLARSLNGNGDRIVRDLGFTGFWCKGEKAYLVWPAGQKK